MPDRGDLSFPCGRVSPPPRVRPRPQACVRRGTCRGRTAAPGLQETPAGPSRLGWTEPPGDLEAHALLRTRPRVRESECASHTRLRDESWEARTVTDAKSRTIVSAESTHGSSQSGLTSHWPGVEIPPGGASHGYQPRPPGLLLTSVLFVFPQHPARLCSPESPRSVTRSSQSRSSDASSLPR